MVSDMRISAVEMIVPMDPNVRARQCQYRFKRQGLTPNLPAPHVSRREGPGEVFPGRLATVISTA